jgi:hypothetical protein
MEITERKNLGHLMLDLETMGKRAGCAIVSIGAVEFDLNTGEIGRQFYERVDLQSCLNVGLFAEASTVYWWMMQSKEARKELCKPADPLKNVLEQFSSFIMQLGEVQIWGDGAAFDLSILKAAYYAVNEKEPWYFRNERDVRTIVMFAPKIKENMLFTGIMHNPISDCKHQIKYCTEIWKKLNNLTTIVNINS